MIAYKYGFFPAASCCLPSPAVRGRRTSLSKVFGHPNQGDQVHLVGRCVGSQADEAPKVRSMWLPLQPRDKQASHRGDRWLQLDRRSDGYCDLFRCSRNVLVRDESKDSTGRSDVGVAIWSHRHVDDGFASCGEDGVDRVHRTSRKSVQSNLT